MVLRLVGCGVRGGSIASSSRLGWDSAIDLSSLASSIPTTLLERTIGRSRLSCKDHSQPLTRHVRPLGYLSRCNRKVNCEVRSLGMEID
jgi:hypothetical protein